MRTRNTIPMSSLAVLAAVPAVLLAGIWQLAEANEPPPTTTTTTTVPPEPVDELMTNLLSPRRHPTPLAERVAAEQSQARFDVLTAGLTDRLADQMCLTIRRGDDMVVDVDGGVALIPASNMKLLVAAVALDTLGADFRFRTELRSVQPVGGVVVGDVWVIGGGDPVLVTAGHVDPLRHPAFNTTLLDPLVDQLVTAGVTSIQGDVVGEASRYDDEFQVPSWGDEITSRDAGPYDALLVNDGLLGNGNYGLVPAQSAANIVDDLIRARGIAVSGSSRHATLPADVQLTTLALIESEPLTDVLIEMLHTSDNNTAEMLLKEIGYQARGEGTRQAGAAVIADRLGAWGVASPVAVLDDGSGLSRMNRLTCELLSGVLATSPVADELVELLPVAGRDGTLADQLLATPAEGELRAKTGTLTGVKALSGELDGADGDPVQFSLILNGDGVDDAEFYGPFWNELVALIDEYPVVIDADVAAFEPR